MIDSSVTEYELTDLKADTNYIVIVKLYNDAGVAEQKFRMRTNDSFRFKSTLVPEYRRNHASKWAIIGIILTILFVSIAIVTGCILLRICRLNGKDKSNNSDHQTTPMMNGEHHSDKSTKVAQSDAIYIDLDD